MGRVEKTVFVSYRRASSSVWALAISQKLTHQGYDVFFDYQTIASGDFDGIIIDNIKARAHFLVLLTPSALERIHEPGDWLRREIEAALEHRRNIVPLMLEGFDFATPSIATGLTGTLVALKSYNGISVPIEYFDAAMERLTTKHLNVALDHVRHPASLAAIDAAKTQQHAVQAAAPVTTEELTAERWFERAFDATDPDTEFAFYTEAIRLKPDFAEAFNNRGLVRAEKGDLDGARGDFTEAIRLEPDYAMGFYNRGNVRGLLRDWEGAIADYSEAIQLRPEDADAFYGRGVARYSLRDSSGAMADYTEAIRLRADYADAFNNRGSARDRLGDLDGALTDYDEAIRLKPDDADTFYNRAGTREVQGDDSGAVADFQKYLDLGGGKRDGDQAEVEARILKLKLKKKKGRKPQKRGRKV